MPGTPRNPCVPRVPCLLREAGTGAPAPPPPGDREDEGGARPCTPTWRESVPVCPPPAAGCQGTSRRARTSSAPSANVATCPCCGSRASARGTWACSPTGLPGDTQSHVSTGTLCQSSVRSRESQLCYVNLITPQTSGFQSKKPEPERSRTDRMKGSQHMPVPSDGGVRITRQRCKAAILRFPDNARKP